MSRDEEEERFLIGQIQRIQDEAQRMAKPYVDRLLHLRSLRPMPPVIITMKQAKEFGFKMEDTK